MDGTGSPWFRGAVLVDNNTLTIKRGEISPDEYEAERVINAEDNIVCPGFVDLHSHAGLTILGEPHHDPKVRQGVTTELIGIDGISMLLILLTTLSTFLVIIAGWEVIQNRAADYMAAFLIMEGLIIGVFSSLDAILFYVFWEASLIPMLLIVGIWGGQNRVYAAIKFFLYTFLGSVFMLVSLIYMYIQGGSFSLDVLNELPLSLTEQSWIFWAFFLAFAVKVPMFPVHTWLPDAHVQAPTGGSVILAAIMLKMGGYGFFRFSLPITPDASSEFAIVVIVLSLIAIVYIGFVALVQKDMKKLIAYSSISHMGFVTLGVFALFSIVKMGTDGQIYSIAGGSLESVYLGLEGAIVQVMGLSFISAALLPKLCL